MCCVHVGADVLDFQDELFDIAVFMQAKCKGIPLVHVSNFVHHLLLNLTVTYTVDFSLLADEDMEKGLGPQHWGQLTDAKTMKVKWHSPTEKEIAFAIKIFQSQGGHAIDSLEALIGADSPVCRDGTGKEWSDEVSRHLVLLRLITSGASCLFNSNDPSVTPLPEGFDVNEEFAESEDESMESTESDDDYVMLIDPKDERIRKTFQYPTGYPLDPHSELFKLVHELRTKTGMTLHRVHEFLTRNQEDDVTCFNALYTAYKSWFVDIGIERSAHVLDRLTRLFAADIHPFKFSGTRKAYTRPLLVKRANLNLVGIASRCRHGRNRKSK